MSLKIPTGIVGAQGLHCMLQGGKGLNLITKFEKKWVFYGLKLACQGNEYGFGTGYGK